MTLPRVGVIGVGAMGMGVARALLAKGFAVTVRDIVAERQAEACSVGARAAPNAAELARAVDVAITLVVDAAQTRDVLLGAQGLAGARSSAAVMMCSTISPNDTEEIARTLPGVDFLDAPISGGPARAHSGTLSMMASGSSAAFARCAPVIEAMAAKCFRVGERPGDGSRMKVVNNMLAAANLAAGCEAMAMASRLGLDLRLVAEVVNASSGGSWIFADRMARALEGDYAPRAAARVLLKDVGLFVGEARKLGLTAPMAEWHAEEDDAAVLKRYAAAWKARVP